MNALELAQTRYSAKHYQTGKPIPPEKVDQLKEILRLAPSSINIQPWRFLFVQDADLKKKLADVSKHNDKKIHEASLLVIFCVADDLEAFEKVVDRTLPKAHHDMYVSASSAMPEADLRAWLKNQVYIALGVGLSAAIALGLDSTPMEGIEPDEYVKILKLTEYKPVFAMAVGYATADDYNRPAESPKSRRPLSDVVVDF